MPNLYISNQTVEYMETSPSSAAAESAASRPPKKIVVLDLSGSMGPSFDDLKDFMRRFFQDNPTGFTLILFGCTVEVLQINQDTTQTELSSFIKNRGTTNAQDAILELMNQISRFTESCPSQRIEAIWVSDGEPNNGTNVATHGAIDLLLETCKANVSIVAVNYLSRLGGKPDTRIASRLGTLGDCIAYSDLPRQRRQWRQWRQYTDPSNPVEDGDANQPLSLHARLHDDMQRRLFVQLRPLDPESGDSRRLKLRFSEQLSTSAAAATSTPSTSGGLIAVNRQPGLTHTQISLSPGQYLLFLGTGDEVPDNFVPLDPNNKHHIAALQKLADQIRTNALGCQLNTGDRGPDALKMDINRIIASILFRPAADSACDDPVIEQRRPLIRQRLADSACHAPVIEQRRELIRQRLEDLRNKHEKPNAATLILRQLLNVIKQMQGMKRASKLSDVNKALAYQPSRQETQARAACLTDQPLDTAIASLRELAAEKQMQDYITAENIITRHKLHLNPEWQERMCFFAQTTPTDMLHAMAELVSKNTNPGDMIDFFGSAMLAPGIAVERVGPPPTDPWDSKLRAHRFPGDGRLLCLAAIMLMRDPDSPHPLIIRGTEYDLHSILTMTGFNSLVSEVLRRTNLDTVMASLTLRQNPTALPTDAAIVLGLVRGNILWKIFHNDKTKKPVCLPDMAELVELTLAFSQRIPKPLRQFAKCVSLTNGDRPRSPFAKLLHATYKVPEMIAYLLSMQVASLDTAIQREAAHQIMCIAASRYSKNTDDSPEKLSQAWESVAINALLAQIIAEASKKLPAFTLTAHCEGQLSVHTIKPGSDQSTQRPILTWITITGSDLKIPIPRGAKVLDGLDGENVLKGAELIEWPNKESSYSVAFQWLAWCDYHDTKQTLDDFFKSIGLHSKFQALMNGSPDTLMDQFSQYVTGNPEMRFQTYQETIKKITAHCAPSEFPTLGCSRHFLKRLESVAEDNALLAAANQGAIYQADEVLELVRRGIDSNVPDSGTTTMTPVIPVIIAACEYAVSELTVQLHHNPSKFPNVRWFQVGDEASFPYVNEKKLMPPLTAAVLNLIPKAALEALTESTVSDFLNKLQAIDVGIACFDINQFVILLLKTLHETEPQLFNKVMPIIVTEICTRCGQFENPLDCLPWSLTGIAIFDYLQAQIDLAKPAETAVVCASSAETATTAAASPSIDTMKAMHQLLEENEIARPKTARTVADLLQMQIDKIQMQIGEIKATGATGCLNFAQLEDLFKIIGSLFKRLERANVRESAERLERANVKASAGDHRVTRAYKYKLFARAYKYKLRRQMAKRLFSPDLTCLTTEAQLHTLCAILVAKKMLEPEGRRLGGENRKNKKAKAGNTGRKNAAYLWRVYLCSKCQLTEERLPTKPANITLQMLCGQAGSSAASAQAAPANSSTESKATPASAKPSTGPMATPAAANPSTGPMATSASAKPSTESRATPAAASSLLYRNLLGSSSSDEDDSRDGESESSWRCVIA